MLLRKKAWQRRETANIRVRAALLRMASGNACPEGGWQRPEGREGVSRADPGGELLPDLRVPEDSRPSGFTAGRSVRSEGRVLINQESPSSPEQGEWRGLASQN